MGIFGIAKRGKGIAKKIKQGKEWSILKKHPSLAKQPYSKSAVNKMFINSPVDKKFLGFLLYNPFFVYFLVISISPRIISYYMNKTRTNVVNTNIYLTPKCWKSCQAFFSCIFPVDNVLIKFSTSFHLGGL